MSAQEDQFLAIREILAGLSRLRDQEQRFSEGGLGNSNAVGVLEQFRLRREAMEARVERLLLLNTEVSKTRKALP